MSYVLFLVFIWVFVIWNGIVEIKIVNWFVFCVWKYLEYFNDYDMVWGVEFIVFVLRIWRNNQTNHTKLVWCTTPSVSQFPPLHN